MVVLLYNGWKHPNKAGLFFPNYRNIIINEDFQSGSARTLDPTNKNYAPELSTFGIIIEVNPSEVQWRGLALEKPPSWSQLISAPGKYELPGRDVRLWTLCRHSEGSRSRGGRMVRPCFHPDRALKVRSKQKRCTAFTFQATIMGQNRLSVGQKWVFLGKVRVKLISRTPPPRPATSINQLARLPQLCAEVIQ